MNIPNMCKNNPNVPITGTFSGNPVLITGGYLTSTECSRQSLTQVGMYVGGTRLLGLYDIATTPWDLVSVKFLGPLQKTSKSLKFTRHSQLFFKCQTRINKPWFIN